MLSQPDRFRDALRQVHAAGAVESIERYTKDKPGDIPPDLRPYYQAKNMFFIRYSTDMEPLFNGKVLDELRASITAFGPMYRYLLDVMETTIAEKGKDYGDKL